MEIHVFWINLSNEVGQKRREKMEQGFDSFNSMNENCIKLIPHRIEGVKYYNSDYDERHNGLIGCCSAHLRAIHTAYTTLDYEDYNVNFDYVIFMEDDIDFSSINSENLIYTLDKSKYITNLDVLQLHWIEPSLLESINKVDDKVINKNVDDKVINKNYFINNYFMSCACYMMTRQGMKKFLDLMSFPDGTLKANLSNPASTNEEFIYRYINSYTILYPICNTIETNNSQICSDDSYMSNNYRNMINLKKIMDKNLNYKFSSNIRLIPYNLHWFNNTDNSDKFLQRLLRNRKDFSCLLIGSLENRLFQYCSIYGLSKKYNAYFDVFASNTVINFNFNKLELDNNINFKINKFFKLDPKVSNKSIDLNLHEIPEIRREIDNLLCHHSMVNDQTWVIAEKDIDKLENSVNKSYIFNGQFQDESYFSLYKEELINFFGIEPPTSILDNIIIVHVDYEDGMLNYRDFNCINLDNYYKRALEIYKDFSFTILSDCPKDIIDVHLPSLAQLTVISEKCPIKCLNLMASSKGVICSTSLLSWWGGWFNQRKDECITIHKLWDENVNISYPKMRRARIVKV